MAAKMIAGLKDTAGVWQKYLTTALDTLPLGLALTDESKDIVVEEEANKILALFASTADLAEAEKSLIAVQNQIPITVLLATKMAMSKRQLLACTKPVHMSWVVAVYGEQNRILRASEHANGENFVRRKVQQMRWLAEGCPKFTWNITYCDDGCPHSSGKLVQGVIDSEGYGDFSNVIYLQDAIDQKLPIIHGLTDAKKSRKGGSVHYGMWWACENSKKDGAEHIVGFTDADLSSHLAQTGLLVAPIVDGAAVTLATRYENGGVECSCDKAELLESNVSNPAGIAFRHYIRKNVLPPLAHIFDTQCGFKAMAAEKAKAILPKVTDKMASFDMEVLLVAGLLYPGAKSLVRCPVTWVASEAESNFWQSASSEYETHYKMNAAIIGLSEKHAELFTAAQQAHRGPFVEFFSTITAAQFEKMCETIKTTVGDDFDRFEMTFELAQLKAWAGVA